MGQIECCCKRDKPVENLEDYLPAEEEEIPVSAPAYSSSEKTFNNIGVEGSFSQAKRQEMAINPCEYLTFQEDNNKSQEARMEHITKPTAKQGSSRGLTGTTIMTTSTNMMTPNNDKLENKGNNNKSNVVLSTNASTLANEPNSSLDMLSFGLQKFIQEKRLTRPYRSSLKMNPKVFIRVYVEYLEMLWKRLDDFGHLFRPYLEIRSQIEAPYRVSSIVEADDLERSMNASLISDNSFISQNLRTNCSGIGRESVLTFKNGKIWEIPPEHYYSNLEFYIKNELKGYTNLTSSENKESNKNPPEVIIGMALVPINLVDQALKEKNESNFDGDIEIRHRNCLVIGHLKLRITVSEKSLYSQEENLIELSKKNMIDIEQSETVSMKSQNQHGNILDWRFIDFNQINPATLEALLPTQDEGQNLLAIAQKVPKFESSITTKVSYDHKLLYKLYKDAIENGNRVSLYQILVLFAKLASKDDYSVIGDFFKLFTQGDCTDFFWEIITNGGESEYIFCNCLSFLWNYLRFYKNNKHSTLRNSQVFNDTKIIDGTLEILLQMISKMKKQYYNPSEWKNKIRECIVWCLDILHDLVTEVNPIDGRYSPEDIFLQKKKDYTNTYINCSTVINERGKIMKTCELYFMDSEIMNLVYKIFRKALLTIINYQSKYLESKLAKNCAKVANDLKVIFIEEEINMNSLKVMLNKYQHYTEIHLSILMILFNITNLNPRQYQKTLILAAKTLELPVFRAGFDIVRGRLKGPFKSINNLHLSVLANLSEIPLSSTVDDQQMDILNHLCEDLKDFYLLTPNYKKYLEDFRQRKKTEFEIHEIISRLAFNITKFPNFSEQLMNTFFFDDIIDYLIIISGVEGNDESDHNSCHSNNSMNINNQTDFVSRIRLKRGKKISEEDTAKLTQSIVENTVGIILNVMLGTESLSDALSTKLADHEIVNAEDLFSLIDQSITVLEKYNINIAKVNKTFSELKKIFE